MSDHHDLPFKAEYAKSNRASCKGCSGNIAKDSLRLAIMIQSPVFDGRIPNWYHHNCFWKRARVPNHADIHGFDALRWEDQQKVKEQISGGGGGAGDGSGGGANYNDFVVQYAKSNRSTCRGCEEKIEKDEVRISKKEYETQRAKMYGPQDLWHHVKCFVENRDDLEFTSDMQPDKIKGFAQLKKDDKDMLLKELGKGQKRKAESQKSSTAKKAKTETPEEKALREQSQLMWEIRDKLYKEVSNDALRGMLMYNDQELPSGESKLLDRVTDCMVFGALKPCPECKEGQLACGSSGYHCTGNMTEWTKCQYVTTKPKRKPFKVPKEYGDVEFLQKYKFVPRERVFPKAAAPSTSGPVSSAAGEASKDKPLSNMKFVIVGKLSKSKGDLTKSITDLGGSVVNKVDKTTAACISCKAEVDKNSKLIKEAKSHDIQVVDEGFLDAVQKGGAMLMIKQHCICDWGSEPLDRLGDVVDGPKKSTFKSIAQKRREKEETMFTKSVPSKMKMMVKGGAAVDPDSGLAETAHVMQDQGDPMSAVLGLVDLVSGTNSYYKLQLLESDSNNRYWVFRAWGRVGTTIGGNKLESKGSKANAIQHFKTLYGEKTGNSWEDRKNFKKYPNKFYPLEIDYGGDDEETVKKLDASAGANSKLPPGVQDLVKMIFDVESMKKAMLEFEIDLKKMPLGKLSKNQIEKAYKVLTELQGLIEKGGTATQFLDASNRFYTLIPHDFGMKKPPLLDTADIIKAKTEMLDNLLEIEVAYSLMKGGDGGGKDPVDVHYEKLKTDIQPLDQKSEEYQRLVDYVKNTHGATHTQYELEVMDIFKVARDGEYNRYKPFKSLHNRMLLWHGSRVTNYAGILSQGLRIAPPEAPVTGYMFGKGIYFADMVSKSANYCRTSQSDPIGIMLLCEVALGNMYELSGSQYITNLPKGKHSTKGCGMTTPDPNGFYTDADGVTIPMGQGTNSTIGRSSLLYNEFIVYDIAQVNIKYALKMNFKYKSWW